MEGKACLVSGAGLQGVGHKVSGFGLGCRVSFKGPVKGPRLRSRVQMLKMMALLNRSTFAEVYTHGVLGHFGVMLLQNK